MTDLTISPTWTAPGEAFRHSWEGVLNIDQFRWMVRKDTLGHLKLAHDELGGRIVRAVGILDDEMRVLGCDPLNARKPGSSAVRSNFQVVDYVIDELLDLGIRPMITTAFVPSALSAGKATVFDTKSITTMPKEFAAWGALIEEMVRHFVGRYGKAEVRNWYFEVWNEPNLKGSFWDKETDNTYDGLYGKLWTTTWRSIKAVDHGLRVGGPSAARGEWIQSLLEFSRRERCEPDYIISHVYNNDSAHGQHSPFLGPDADRANDSPNFTRGVVRGARKILDDWGFRGEVHWNEWGTSWFPSEPMREMPQEAAWVCRTMGEVSQLATYYAYWALSDIYNQVGYGRETFHNHYGMMNLQGLRKPAWFAHMLLAKLGDRRLPAQIAGGDEDLNAIVTSGPGGRAALVYASQYNAPQQFRRHEVRVKLPGAPAKGVRLWRINEDENNILALWRAMGSPAYLNAAERAYLREQNHLQVCYPREVQVEQAADGHYARFALPAPGVALLELPD